MYILFCFIWGIIILKVLFDNADITKIIFIGTLAISICFGCWVRWLIQNDLLALLVTSNIALLLIGAIIDKQFTILPDEGAVLLCIFGFLHRLLRGDSIIVGVALAILILILSFSLSYLSHNGFGLGDGKWLSSLSLWLNAVEIYEMITLSFLLAFMYILVLKTLRKDIGEYIAFGPFIALSFWLIYSMGLQGIYIYE